MRGISKKLFAGGLLLSVLTVAIACTSTEVVKTDGRASFERKGKDGKWAWVDPGYMSPNGRAGESRSEAVYDRFEKLGMADISHGRDLYVLYREGKKYLFDAEAAALRLDGNEYTHITKDNGGYLYAETPVGLYPLNGNTGLPERVSTIFRCGPEINDAASLVVIYSQDGKYGVYRYQADVSGSVFSSPKYSYAEIIPPVYDRIIYVGGGGAGHFVVCKDGETSLFDSKGRLRTMGRDESTWLKGYYQFTGGFWAQSARPAQGRYLKTINGIPLGAEHMRVADLRSYCTHMGTLNASSIRIDPFSDDEYEGPFMPNHGDGSMTNLD